MEGALPSGAPHTSSMHERRLRAMVAVLAYAKALFTTVVAARSFGKAFVLNQAFSPAIHLGRKVVVYLLLT